MTPTPDSLPDKTISAEKSAPPRPAMPSGTVRTRRMHSRHRKGKARVEQVLEPVAPTSDASKPPRPPKTTSHPKPHISPVKPHISPAKSASTPVTQQPPPAPQPAQTRKSPPSARTLVDAPLPPVAPTRLSPTSKAHPLQEMRNHVAAHADATASRLVAELSPVKSARSSQALHSTEESENVPPPFVAVDTKVHQPERRDLSDVVETDDVARLAARMKLSSGASRTRPLICQDITNSNADTLRISRLPRGVTYDRLLSMVEPFGEVDELAWTATDPYVCDVTYRDPAAAREAKHFLGDALVGSDSEPPLKAELRSRDPGAQLFVGDLTPDVTEEMLEAAFSELVGEPVSALLKRDPDSFSPIGYGFLSFKNESSANFALVAGHRTKVGNACVRVGRAERNTHLYVSDLAPSVSMEELKTLFGKFGSLVEEDTVIVRRSYAFIRYKNRGAAEKAKRTLDKTDLKGRLSVRYAEAEPLKACVAVQFHSSVPRPPNSLRDLLSATFSKHGNCSVEIPRLQNGMWRKVAFVTYHGDPIAANLAALEAVQSIRFVSSLPVCCQFARELVPRFPSRGLRVEKMNGAPHETTNTFGVSERPMTRNFLARKALGRRTDSGQETGITQNRSGQQTFEPRGRHFNAGNVSQAGNPDFVPVYVPITALQSNQMTGGPSQVSEGDFQGYQPSWQQRMMMGNSGSVHQNVHPGGPAFNGSFNSFTPLQERMMRW